MAYVIAAVVVMLVVTGFVVFMVTNATKKSGPVADRPDEGPPGIGTDETPLGDTSQHAGHQTEEGTTVGGQDAEESGGTGEPVEPGLAGNGAGGGRPPEDPEAAAHRARPGEAEGEQRIAFDPHRSDSERLADRDR
jgi:hypothetical protein